MKLERNYWFAAKEIVILLALMALANAAAAQQNYPVKPIRLIVPYAPGGSTGVVAGIVGQKFTESWGQQVMVDHRPGGNTIIGTDALAKSPPDGYTILFVTNTHVINALIPGLPYDSNRDFAPVGTVDKSEYVLVVNARVPANNLQEFIAAAKARPGGFNYSSAGAGSMSHLAGELFNITTGVKIHHVPYKGQGPSMTDLVAGHVQLSFTVPASSLPFVKSGKLKAIAISGEARAAALPQVPTFAEAGLRGFSAKNWHGVLAPAGTPKDTIGRLAAQLARLLSTPEVKSMLLGQGLEPLISTPEQFAAMMKSELTRYARIVKQANIKLQN